MNNKKVEFLTKAALIAAIYVTLTFAFAPISFSEVQVRISESLTILPLFTPAAIPGLFVGCLLGNLLSGAALPDVIFGSLATLLGAMGTYMLKDKKPVLGTIPPILSNTIVIPFILRMAYQVTLPMWMLFLSIGAGEVLSCGVLGMVLYKVLSLRKNEIFGENESNA